MVLVAMFSLNYRHVRRHGKHHMWPSSFSRTALILIPTTGRAENVRLRSTSELMYEKRVHYLLHYSDARHINIYSSCRKFYMSHIYCKNVSNGFMYHRKCMLSLRQPYILGSVSLPRARDDVMWPVSGILVSYFPFVPPRLTTIHNLTCVE